MAKKATRTTKPEAAKPSVDTTDADAVAALTHSGRTKSYLHRLAPDERKELAQIWCEYKGTRAFNEAMAKFYATRSERLAAAKATESDSAEDGSE